MLLESFAPEPDASEVHQIEIRASPDAVYQALWSTNFGSSPIVMGLLGLRSLPRLILGGGQRRSVRQLTLQSVIDAGFGRLAEEPGREIVLGVSGRFWRPIRNVERFDQESFSRPVPPGMARAVWNFRVVPSTNQGTILSTETRVTCGDSASRRKFRVYWLVIRPFSGLIRIIMLRAVQQAAEPHAA
jgi:hypothetical protein